jgi:hypothetical protein
MERLKRNSMHDESRRGLRSNILLAQPNCAHKFELEIQGGKIILGYYWRSTTRAEILDCSGVAEICKFGLTTPVKSKLPFIYRLF